MVYVTKGSVIVPAFPDAQRIAVGEYLLVNGIPLQESDAAKDPKRPINISIIEDLVKNKLNTK